MKSGRSGDLGSVTTPTWSKPLHLRYRRLLAVLAETVDVGLLDAGKYEGCIDPCDRGQLVESSSGM